MSDDPLEFYPLGLKGENEGATINYEKIDWLSVK